MSENRDQRTGLLKVYHWLIGSPIRPLLSAAELTFQRPSQTPDSEPRFYFYARVGLLTVLTTAALLLFEPALVSRFGKSGQPEFTTLFMQDRWKILFSEAIQVGVDEGCEGTTVARTCPAHNDFVIPKLTEAQVQSTPSSFWMIYDLTKEEALKAAEAGANIMFADRIGGREKVYVNGNLMATGASRSERGVLLVTIPALWLEKKLRLAVWVEPDLRVASSNGVMSLIPKNIGLTNSENSRKMVRVRNFVDENIHLIMASVYFMLTVFFILLWSATPQQREPFVFALYCVISGLLSARQSGSVYFALRTYQWYHLELFLHSAQGLAVIWAGFAIARIRREITLLAGAGYILQYLYWAMISGTATEYYAADKIVSTYSLSTAYLVSSLTCFLQFYWVRHQIHTRHAYWLKRRQTVLAIYCAIFLFLLLLHASSLPFFGSLNQEIQFLQYSPVFVFLLVGFGLFQDLQSGSGQNELAPLSRFHRMSPMPEVVNGVLLGIDLKRSEALYRSASYSNDQNMFVSPFVNSWLAILHEIGADLIQFQGDEIMVIFETPDPTPGTLTHLLQDISDALVRMDQLMPKIADELEQKTSVSITAAIGRPAFRATISMGAIRPTLIGQGGFKIAGWMNTDEKQVLMRMARLSDAEKVVLSNMSALDGYTGSTLSIDEETIPAETIEQCLAVFEKLDLPYQRGLRTFLKSKGSAPPVLTLICLGRAAEDSGEWIAKSS